MHFVYFSCQNIAAMLNTKVKDRHPPKNASSYIPLLGGTGKTSGLSEFSRMLGFVAFLTENAFRSFCCMSKKIWSSEAEFQISLESNKCHLTSLPLRLRTFKAELPSKNVTHILSSTNLKKRQTSKKKQKQNYTLDTARSGFADE